MVVLVLVKEGSCVGWICNCECAVLRCRIRRWVGCKCYAGAFEMSDGDLFLFGMRESSVASLGPRESVCEISKIVVVGGNECG